MEQTKKENRIIGYVPPGEREVELRPGRDVLGDPGWDAPRDVEVVKGAAVGTKGEEEEVSVSTISGLLDVPGDVVPRVGGGGASLSLVV